MRKFFILLIFFFSYASFSMEQLKDLPKKPVETAQLARKYQKLCDTYNNNSTIIKLEESCSEFEDSIFYLIDKNTDSTSFLNISRKILKRIKDALDNQTPTGPCLSAFLEEKILKLLKNRIDLARLDENVFDGFGSIGGLNNFKNPHLQERFNNINIQNAISTLTGRIFQVELIDGVVDIDQSSILTTSSGTMINFNQLNKKIENLSPSIATNLNSVLTCAHSLSTAEGRAKFYFVPTSQLDLTTGFPPMVNNIKGNGGLIHFLENNPNSYPLDKVHIKNTTLNHWREYDLDMGQPQFLENEDLVIGHLDMTNRKQPLYNIDYAVSFLPDFINDGGRYFTTGYPGCDHYSLDPFKSLQNYNLIQEDSLSPFFITSCIKNANDPVTINPNGSIFHRCPSSTGMSGGSIFHLVYGANHINIFGIITSGEDINEKGCHWH